MHVWVPGDTTISVSTMDGESTPEMKMETAFVKSMSIPWKGFGLSCEAGCAPIGAFHKRNFRSTSVSSSLCTMPENEGKRCFMRSLSYWSNKTLESNMSLTCHIRLLCCVVPLPWQSLCIACHISLLLRNRRSRRHGHHP